MCHQLIQNPVRVVFIAFWLVCGLHTADAADDGSKNRFYRGLNSSIDFYQKIKAKGGWPQIASGPTLKPGMSDPRVVSIRKRLSITRDYQGSNLSSTLYDDELKQAVIAYQSRNGREPDGIVGKETLQDLNISVDERIRLIMINQERWRRMPPALGKKFVLVNMAGFELDVIEGEKTVLEMRVIIGKNYHMTPMFSDMIKTIEINPYWNVPESIATNELVPAYIKGVGSALQQGFEIVKDGRVMPLDSINWSDFSGRKLPFTIRQKPGPSNALGEMKFLFPNKHNVYLHDTNARGLFARTIRAFSHGCIRIEKPRELATYLLRANGNWTRERIDMAVSKKTTTAITLKEPVPVHMAYMTAWLDRRGFIQFRPDIYGRDALLSKELFGN